MTRERRIAKLIAHRQTEVDHAASVLQSARQLAVLAQRSVIEADEYLNAARSVTAKEMTAGDMREIDAHIRSLAARRIQLVARAEAARMDEHRNVGVVLNTRVELKKMEHIQHAIAAKAAREEDQAAQRATDDRFGSLPARRSA